MDKVEVVIVGAGLAGLSAAYVLADAGVEVLVVERGDFPGSKNVSGGRLYLEPVRAYLPGLFDEAPFERQVVKERLTMLTSESSVTVELASDRFRSSPANSVTVLRARFDQWLAEKASEKGAFIIPGYKVDDVWMEEGRVAGIRSNEDILQADVVIAADGVLSFIAEKAGMRECHQPRNVALGVKEIIELPEKRIQDLFGLKAGEGATQLFFGSITEGMMGGGFLYTNQTSLSLGMVISIHDLMQKHPTISPHDLFELFKKRPEIEVLISGGHSVEYSAHDVPEGGLKSIPRLYAGGLLVAGDAAGLCLNQGITLRGMDMAIVSGVLAGRAVLDARQKKDYTAESLGIYEKYLKGSSIYQDLSTFQHMPEILSNPRLFEKYPEVASELLLEIFRVDAQPKQKISRTVLRTISRELLKVDVLRDLWHMRKI
ncbi:MAG: FAD-dependent oxidoreductase [Anaerolineales bacterium]|nr:FAD-dependent oxidoreductase [Anaerolineales bacterium]